MPEGDTIRQFAAALEPLLLDQPLEGAEVRAGDFGFRGERLRHLRRQRVEALEGRRVRHLEVVGKHLMLWFDEGPGLRVHLGLGGDWHAYAPDERWARPDREAGVLLRTREQVVVCFSPMHVEWLDPRRRANHPILGRLGPDLLHGSIDLDVVVGRAANLLDEPVGVVLLDQRVAAGIGNVVRSEVLFLRGVHPSRLARDVDLRAAFELARTILLDNVRPGPRMTTDAEVRAKHGPRARLYVYGRHGAPCWRCGTTVQVERIGDQPRGVWWCPSCQPADSVRLSPQGCPRSE